MAMANMDGTEAISEVQVHIWEATLSALFDTFVKYLRPAAIIPYLGITGKKPDNASDLLYWAMDEDGEKDSVPRQLQFIRALRAANTAGCEIFCGVASDQNMNGHTGLLIQILDGSLLQRLTAQDVDTLAQTMLEHNFLSQRQASELQRLTQTENPQRLCLEMFGKIKRGKEDWPFVFLAAVSRAHPDLCEQQYQVGSRVLVPEEVRNTTLMRKILRTGAILEHELLTDSESSAMSETFDWDVGFSDEEEKHESEESEKGATAAGAEPGSCGRDLNLRAYQLELAQRALTGQNTIICAPTGSGKTRVSTYIICRHLESGPGRKVAFLARTVPLVQQQCSSLKKYLLNWKIGQVTGDSEFRTHISFLLPQLDVIVMTPKILENHIRKGALTLGNFTLMVFDECHHTRKDEPYNTLMFEYLKIKHHPRAGSEGLPQIVGLTATIGIEGASTKPDAVQNILKVCGNLDCDNVSMVTEHQDELQEIVPVPDEEIFALSERGTDECVRAIEKVMEKLEFNVKQHAKDLNDPKVNEVLQAPDKKKSQQYNQWALELKRAAQEVPLGSVHSETNMSVRLLIILCDYLKEYNIALESLDLVQTFDVMQYLKKAFVRFEHNQKQTKEEMLFFQFFLDLQEELKNKLYHENRNLKVLATTLQKHLIDKGEKSCGIVFVRTRALAFALTSWLKRCGRQHLESLNAAMFTGVGAKADQLGMTQSDQEAVIEKFRSGKTRLLVATTVAEEGLDIPECNLVIKYNHVGNEVTTVQTRGRSRKRGGISILLAMEKVAFKEIVNQGKARLMKEAVLSLQDIPQEEIAKSSIQYQKNLLVEAEKNRLLKLKETQMLLNRKFRMVCKLCRKLEISSDDVRTIEGVHRIVIDDSIWTKVRVHGSGATRDIDDVKMLGTVKCCAEPKPGKRCNQHLGSLILYTRTPFINLGVTNFVFEDQPGVRGKAYKKWKNVPFAVHELNNSDIKRYLNIEEPVDEETAVKGLSEVMNRGDEDKGPSAKRLSERTGHSGYKDENALVKRAGSSEDEDETHMKHTGGVEIVQRREEPDSGLFTGSSLKKSGADDTNTVMKQAVTSEQQVHAGMIRSSMITTRDENQTIVKEITIMGREEASQPSNGALRVAMDRCDLSGRNDDHASDIKLLQQVDEHLANAPSLDTFSMHQQSSSPVSQYSASPIGHSCGVQRFAQENNPQPSGPHYCSELCSGRDISLQISRASSTSGVEGMLPGNRVEELEPAGHCSAANAGAQARNFQPDRNNLNDNPRAGSQIHDDAANGEQRNIQNSRETNNSGDSNACERSFFDLL